MVEIPGGLSVLCVAWLVLGCATWGQLNAPRREIPEPASAMEGE